MSCDINEMSRPSNETMRIVCLLSSLSSELSRQSSKMKRQSFEMTRDISEMSCEFS
jgi:hypothetical protein